MTREQALEIVAILENYIHILDYMYANTSIFCFWKLNKIERMKEKIQKCIYYFLRGDYEKNEKTLDKLLEIAYNELNK